MKSFSDMKLSEKNNLYLKQKKEIEQLKSKVAELEKIIEEYNKEPKKDLIDSFLSKNCLVGDFLKVEAKYLHEAFKKSLVNRVCVKNRTFYSSLKLRGFQIKRGSKNKLYIYGLELK